MGPNAPQIWSKGARVRLGRSPPLTPSPLVAAPYYGHSSLNIMNMHLVNIDVWSHVGPYLGIDEALSARTRMMMNR